MCLRFFFLFFPLDKEMLQIRKELCKVNFGISVAAGPPKVESKRAHSLPLLFSFRSPSAESNTTSPPRKVGQPRLTFPISENSLYPSEATNHTKLPFQLFQTHSGGLTATPPDFSLFGSSHLDAGGGRTPGHDVTAPGTSRGAGW